MVSTKVVDAFNAQIVAETYSAYLYLSMSAYFEDQNLPGYANWMRCQAQEEMLHAMKFYGHLVGRDARVLLGAIDAPPTEWDSPAAVFEAAYGHEQKVTGMINNLVDLATSEKDHASGPLLQWFVAEQIEEEDSANTQLEQLKRAADSPSVLLMLDREAGQRVFTPPPAAGEGGNA